MHASTCKKCDISFCDGRDCIVFNSSAVKATGSGRPSDFRASKFSTISRSTDIWSTRTSRKSVYYVNGIEQT